MFQLHNISSEGKRGRPAHPKAIKSTLKQRVLNAKGRELGLVELAEKDGSVILTAVIEGKKKMVTFPATQTKTRVRKATKPVEQAA